MICKVEIHVHLINSFNVASQMVSPAIGLTPDNKFRFRMEIIDSCSVFTWARQGWSLWSLHTPRNFLMVKLAAEVQSQLLMLKLSNWHNIKSWRYISSLEKAIWREF